MVVHGTNLPNPDQLAHRGQRLATILLVADGVGGSAAGSKASRIAAEAVTRYVSSSLRCYHAAGSSGEEELIEALRGFARQFGPRYEPCEELEHRAAGNLPFYPM